MRWVALSFLFVTFLYDTNGMDEIWFLLGRLKAIVHLQLHFANPCSVSLQKEVVVAAERSSAKARLGGRLFVYSL